MARVSGRSSLGTARPSFMATVSMTRSGAPKVPCSFRRQTHQLGRVAVADDLAGLRVVGEPDRGRHRLQHRLQLAGAFAQHRLRRLEGIADQRELGEARLQRRHGPALD